MPLSLVSHLRCVPSSCHSLRVPIASLPPVPSTQFVTPDKCRCHSSGIRPVGDNTAHPRGESRAIRAGAAEQESGVEDQGKEGARKKGSERVSDSQVLACGGGTVLLPCEEGRE